MVKKTILLTTIALLLFGCTQLSSRKAEVREPSVWAGATYRGSQACFECHEEMTGERNVHMRLASFEVPQGQRVGCEGCHGPGSAHMDGDGDASKIFRFSKGGLSPEEVAGVCARCHQVGEHMNWPGSAHAENGVSCTQCHKVHGNGDTALLAEKEPRLCASCHQDVVAQGYFASHHPVKEGKMGCSDCHNVHGGFGSAMLRTDERPNDLCLTCHTRYQGPFVFEHDPVVEDCMICHDPHGTVANNLLRQQEPFICLQCHEAHFHSARASNNVIDVPAPGDTANTIAAADHGFTKSFMTKCTQCHSQVHGSDLPSQSVPGAGTGLTR